MNSFYNQNFQYDPNEVYRRKTSELKGIRTIGKVSGICIIIYVVLEQIIPAPIRLSEKLIDLYKNSDEFYYMLVIALSLISVLGVFYVGGVYLKKKTGDEFLLLEKPADTRLAVYATGTAFLICLAGNYVTSWFLSIMESFGIELTTPDMETPATVSGRIMFVIAIALIPPLAEEVAIRGAILQPLRRYGEGFAVVASSLVFAVLHGNLVQAPFAFIAGLGLGYICCLTNSLWPGIIAHFLNNMYSCIVDFMVEDIKDEAAMEKAYVMFTAALFSFCIVFAIMFVINLNHRKLRKPLTICSNGEKFKPFILNVPMIIALITMIGITSLYVRLT